MLSTDDWTDEELLPRLFVRNRQAWCEFHRRFDHHIHQRIRAVTARVKGVDVDEIYGRFVMAIMADDFRKLRRYDPERGTSLSTWLGVIATNLTKDHLRALSRRPACVEMEAVHHMSADSASPFDTVAAREGCERLAVALRSLPARDRRFVELYYLNGLSVEDVAAAMGVSVKTVYTKKHKIRTRLRSALRA